MITLRESVESKYYRSFPRIADCAVEETISLQPTKRERSKTDTTIYQVLSGTDCFTNSADGALPQTPPLTAAEARGNIIYDANLKTHARFFDTTHSSLGMTR